MSDDKLFPTTKELKVKCLHGDWSRLTSTRGHSVHVVVVSVIPSVASKALQASVCDERFVSVGGAIALPKKNK